MTNVPMLNVTRCLLHGGCPLSHIMFYFTWYRFNIQSRKSGEHCYRNRWMETTGISYWRSQLARWFCNVLCRTHTCGAGDSYNAQRVAEDASICIMDSSLPGSDKDEWESDVEKYIDQIFVRFVRNIVYVCSKQCSMVALTQRSIYDLMLPHSLHRRDNRGMRH